MEKKTKLTISGSAKKSIRNIEIAKTQGKNSRVIEKQGGKFTNRGGSFRPGVGKPKSTTSFNRGAPLKTSFAPPGLISVLNVTIKMIAHMTSHVDFLYLSDSAYL